MNLKKSWPLIVIAALGITSGLAIAQVATIIPLSIQGYLISGLALYALVTAK